MLDRRANGQAKLDVDALMARIAELEGKLARNTKVSIKISEKSAVSVFHGRRWPTSLYAQEWQKVLDHADEIKGFIEANRDQLSWKE